MAKIPQSNGGGLGSLGEPPPTGTYLAVCLDVLDLYGVERNKYQSEEKELQDVTRFVFGVKTKGNGLHKIATKEMKISGSPKANLVKFLKSWTGEQPKGGWDTSEMIGKGAQITVVAEEARNGKTYRNIGSIAPVMDGLEAKVPKAEAFANVGGESAEEAPESGDPF